MVGHLLKYEINQKEKDLNLEHNIKIHGVLNDNEMNNLLNICDIFLMLSENLDNGDIEGFGIVGIIEANYLGLPAIGSKNCGIEDDIKDGYSGHLVDNKDAIAISKSLKLITNDYTKYSLSALKWAEKFSCRIKLYLII